MVFHCPHDGHLPVHFALSLPHTWQKYAVLIFDINKNKLNQGKKASNQKKCNTNLKKATGSKKG